VQRGERLQRRHIPQLDGLRAFAVLLVLLAHAAVDFTGVASFRWIDRYGSLGVQLFFVLSGFLITRILLESKGSPHFFRNFFVRRALRIYPLYYAVLAFVIFSGVVHQHGVSWWPYVLYLSNIVYSGNQQPAPLGPVWSLAVEEQFYLLWPFIVFLVSRRNLERLCLAMLVAAIGLRFTGILAIHNTLLQLDALAIGAIIACRFEQVSAWRGAARFVCLLLPLGVTMPFGMWSSLSQTVQVVSGAALLVVLLDSSSAVSRVFRGSFLQYVGKISYGIYLLHSLIFAAFLRSQLCREVVRSGSAFKAVLCLAGEFGLALGFASLSFYALESPFLRLKRYFEAERPSSSTRRDELIRHPAPVEAVEV
jgi:peptidoglycan/LPS O-acetylase OafA/YrhL